MSQCENIKSIDTHTSDSSCVSNTANSSNLLNNINDTNEKESILQLTSKLNKPNDNIIPIQGSVKVEKVKKKKNKCFHCNKKIGFMKFNCKCSDHNFCSSCVLPEIHMCKYDFKSEQRKNLEAKLVKVVNNKIETI